MRTTKGRRSSERSDSAELRTSVRKMRGGQWIDGWRRSGGRKGVRRLPPQAVRRRRQHACRVAGGEVTICKSRGGKETATNALSGRKETADNALLGREDQQPAAGDAIERLQALQQAQEAVLDAEKAAFDWLDAMGNSEPRWLQLLEESAGGGNADSGIHFVCEGVAR